MKKTTLVLGLLAALTGTVTAQEGAVPKGIPHLDHVFVIMMENHGYGEILDNPNAPFINQYARNANLADQLLRRRTSQPDQLPGNRGRIEFRRAERQLPGLAQRHLRDESRRRESRIPTTRRAPPFARSRAAGPMPPHRPSTAPTRSRDLRARSTLTAKRPTRPPPVHWQSRSPISWLPRERPGRAIRKTFR